jgi:hypothetical protein
MYKARELDNERRQVEEKHARELVILQAEISKMKDTVAMIKITEENERLKDKMERAEENERLRENTERAQTTSSPRDDRLEKMFEKALLNKDNDKMQQILTSFTESNSAQTELISENVQLLRKRRDKDSLVKTDKFPEGRPERMKWCGLLITQKFVLHKKKNMMEELINDIIAATAHDEEVASTVTELTTCDKYNALVDSEDHETRFLALAGMLTFVFATDNPFYSLMMELICTKFDDNTPVSAFIARCSAIKTTWQTFYLLFGKGFMTSLTDSDMKTSTFKSFDYFADNKMPLEDAARDDSAQDLLFGFAVHLAMPRKLQYKMANKQLWGYNKQKKWLGKDNTPYSLTEADRLSLTTRQLVRSYYNGDGPVDPSTETPGPPRTPEYPRPHDPE